MSIDPEHLNADEVASCTSSSESRGAALSSALGLRARLRQEVALERASLGSGKQTDGEL
jgi:hypothetical protein